jgi:hypothetical protein
MHTAHADGHTTFPIARTHEWLVALDRYGLCGHVALRKWSVAAELTSGRQLACGASGERMWSAKVKDRDEVDHVRLDQCIQRCYSCRLTVRNHAYTVSVDGGSDQSTT